MKLRMSGISCSVAGVIRSMLQLLQGFHVRADSAREAGQAVASFKNGDQTPARMLVGDLEHDARQVGEVGVSELEMSQRIASAGIETCGNQYQVGLDFVGLAH